MKILNFNPTPSTPPINIPLTSPSQSETNENISVNPDACAICLKVVTNEQKAIMCDRCSFWVHTKCHQISNIEYENYKINYELEFECKICRKCAICNKTIAKNHKKLECSFCKKYVHIKCNRLNVSDYDKLVKLKSNFTCIPCISSQIPFTAMPDNQFDMLTLKQPRGGGYHPNRYISGFLIYFRFCYMAEIHSS